MILEEKSSIEWLQGMEGKQLQLVCEEGQCTKMTKITGWKTFCSIILDLNEKGKMEENVVMMWDVENLDESMSSVGGYERLYLKKLVQKEFTRFILRLDIQT